MLGIKLGLSTAYHPQTDSQTERINQEVKQYLRHFVNEQQNDWSSLFPTAEFALNNQVNASTGKSPFELVYSYSPRCQETRTPATFFPIFLTMDAPPFLSLATSPLYVLPNRPHSPPSLVFIVASSLT